MRRPPFGDDRLQPFGTPTVWAAPDYAACAISDTGEALHALTQRVLATDDLSLASEALATGALTPHQRALIDHSAADALRSFSHLWQGQRVLEVGPGGGSGTRLLAAGAKSVTALEPNLYRAQLCRARTRDLTTVDVVCAPVEDLPHAERFDVVVALGAIDTMAPADAAAWLGHVRRWLAPTGVLLVGAHNALSPGFIAASANNPALAPLHWGESSLKELLTRVGLRGQRAFAAFPCLQATQLILTEEGACAPAEVLTPLLCELRREPIATGIAVAQATRSLPAALWPTIVRHGLALALAPALLVVGRAQPLAQDDDLLQDDRDLAYGFATQRPKALHKQSTLRMHNGHCEIIRRRIYPAMRPVHGLLTQRLDDEAVPPGETLTERLRHAMDAPGWSAASIALCLRPWADYLERHERAPHDDDARAVGAAGVRQLVHRGAHRGVVPGHFIDVGPGNTALCGQGNVEAFSLEWDLARDVPLSWVLMRGVARALVAQTSVAPPAPDEPVALGPLVQRVLGHLKTPLADADVMDLFEQEVTVFGAGQLTVDVAPVHWARRPITARELLSQRLLVRDTRP